MLKQFAFILTLLLAITGFSQKPLYTYSKHFSVEDGLPQSFISSIVQDRDGFLWISTRDGLARYDGREFRVFRQRSVPSNVIQSIFYDGTETLWIRFENASVLNFNIHSFQWKIQKEFPLFDSLFRIGSWNFFAARNQKYWSTAYNGDVMEMDLNTGTILNLDKTNNELHKNIKHSICTDKSGRWFIYYPDGIDISDTAKKKFRFIPFPFSITQGKKIGINKAQKSNPAILFDEAVFAMADNDRIIFYDEKKNEFSITRCGLFETGSADDIQWMMVGTDGLLYFGKMGKVFRIESSGSISFLWETPYKEFPYAQSALLDRSNVLWFGTNAAGLYKVDFAALPFTSSTYTSAFTLDVLSQLPGVTRKDLPSAIALGSDAYRFRYSYDTEGNLFFLNQAENLSASCPIYFFKNGKFGEVKNSSLKEGELIGLSVTKTGEIYGADNFNGFYKWNNSESFPSYKKLTTVVFQNVLTDEKGGVWATTEGDGIFYIKNDSVVDRYWSENKKFPLPGNVITDMIPDPGNNNQYWVGTLGQGMFLFNTEKGVVKLLTTESGLPNNTVYCIVPDHAGNLWASTNKGICRINRKDFSIKSFDISDGLPENEFNRFHSFRFPDGRIAFGGGKGYTMFDPMQLKEDSFSTAVQVTKFMVNNNVVEFGDSSNILAASINEIPQLVLPYNKNFLSFEFSGLQFNHPGKIKYRYRLKGYDKDWIETGNRNIASYTKLPPGRYTLFINASNTSGKWSSYVKEIGIRIKPPFWATWWAYTVYVLIILLLVNAYFRYRAKRLQLQNEVALEHKKTEQLREVDEMKTRFFSNITHELRTPLTLILTPLEKMTNENKYSAADQRAIANAHRNAEQLLRLINQLLDLSKLESGRLQLNKQTGDLAEFVRSCVEQFRYRAQDKDIQLNFSALSVSGHYNFDEDKLEKIIFNLVSNAVKFTGKGGEVNILLEEIEGKTRITVSDTGSGIAENDLEKIFDRFYMADDSFTRKQSGTGIGLSLVKELADLMQGVITVKSTVGKGSSFIIDLPLEKPTDDAPVSIKPLQAHERTQPVTKSPQPKTETDRQIILLAEDNDELRQFITESLSANWRVISAENGKTAWEMTLNEMPDIIISDLMMPEISGDEFCKMVKDDTRTGHIPFILLTAKAALSSKMIGLQKGADEYLTKPFNFDELELRLQNIAKQQERLRNHLTKELLPEAPLKKLPHVNDIFIQDLHKHLDELLIDPNFSVDTLARKMAMSQRTLNRKLKAILNITPVEFIRKYRLQKASVLLASGHAVADAAYLTGFDTASYFTQCFKDEFGKTPTEFSGQKTA